MVDARETCNRFRNKKKLECTTNEPIWKKITTTEHNECILQKPHAHIPLVFLHTARLLFSHESLLLCCLPHGIRAYTVQTCTYTRIFTTYAYLYITFYIVCSALVSLSVSVFLYPQQQHCPVRYRRLSSISLVLSLYVLLA